MHQKKAVLIELSDYHDGCLHAQAQFLKWGGFDVTLAGSPTVLHRVRTEIPADRFWECPAETGLGAWRQAVRLRRRILQEGITHVVFNTAQNEGVRNLCLLPFPPHVRFAGTLHNLRKLNGSITQRLISRRVRRYFLLAHHLKAKVPDAARKVLDFEAFYPMFFPPYPVAGPKPVGSFWIGIPGVVEYSRRDYEGLARALAALQPRPDVRFLLLGNAFHPNGNGPEFVRLIEELGVSGHFQLWDRYVDDTTFHSHVQACDALLPAIHPVNADYEDYLERQISGTWILGFAYQKPLLLAEGFSAVRDLAGTGIFYDPEQLPAFLERLPGVLAVAPATPYDGREWTFEGQAERYLRFLTANEL